MSYTPATLSQMSQATVEGVFKEWVYLSSDPISSIIAAGYFADGAQKGMRVGDLVWVVNQAAGALAITKCQCSAVASSVQGPLTFYTSSTVQQAEETMQSFSVDPRNLIDAGDFTVNPWQLGTSFTSIAPGGTLTADRWCANAGASVIGNVSKQTNTQVAGFSAALQWGRSAGDTHSTGLTVGQVLETLDSIRTQGLPITLSFWANAGASFAAGAGSFNAAVISGAGSVDDTFINLVSSGWTGATNVISTSVVPTTAAVRYGPFTGVVPAGCTQLGVVFDYTPVPGTTAGANEWIQLMGVQLEIGGMTSYEHLDVAYVLEQCQRYLIVINEGTTGTPGGAGSAVSATTGQIFIPLPMTMRKPPTVTFTIGGFEVTTGAGAGQAITSAGSLSTQHTQQAVGLLVTTGGTLTAGQASLLVGRSTGLGSIKIDADYA